MGAKDVMIGLNRDEGTLNLLMSGIPQFGPGVEKHDPLNEMTFDGLVRYGLPEAEDEFVMEKIRQQYYKGKIEDIARFFADVGFVCDIAATADALEKTGDRKVVRYLFDVVYEYVKKSYPYAGASHALELPALWGRPYMEMEIYSSEERKVAGEMMYYWGAFAKGTGDDFFSMIPKGRAFVIQKGDDYQTEKYDTEKCHFLDCIPSIAEFSRTQYMSDMSCAKYLVGAAGKLRAPGSSLIAAIAVLLRQFLIFK